MPNVNRKLILTGQAALFFLAALFHSGLAPGYAHRHAMIAETVIGGVLLLGAILVWAYPARERPIFVGAQSFALLGTLVGLFTIFVGVGPQTVADLFILGILLFALFSALMLTSRRLSRRDASSVFREDRQ